MPAHVSNFTDFAPLAAEPDVRLRQVRTREEWGNPDLVILPGTKSVAADLAGLRAAGMEEPIRRHAEQGKWMLGVCGGLQMLGTDILDPLHMESAEEQTPGLGLLELSTTFAAAKTLLNVRRASTPLAPPAAGYEIHHGVTRHEGASIPIMFREDGSPCGYGKGRIWATYLHGILDGDQFRRAFINMVRVDSGLSPNPSLHASYDLDGALDRLGGRSPGACGPQGHLPYSSTETLTHASVPVHPACGPSAGYSGGGPAQQVPSRLPDRLVRASRGNPGAAAVGRDFYGGDGGGFRNLRRRMACLRGIFPSIFPLILPMDSLDSGRSGHLHLHGPARPGGTCAAGGERPAQREGTARRGTPFP